MTQENFEGQLPEGWNGATPVTKRWNGDFVHLYRLTRPCKTCGNEIRIDVTKRALQGSVKNAGLLLKNCVNCRTARKNGGAGSRGGTSRPQVEVVDAEPLRTMVTTMKEELTGLYAENKELRARLAKYELQTAMASATTGTLTMPWEQT